MEQHIDWKKHFAVQAQLSFFCVTRMNSKNSQNNFKEGKFFLPNKPFLKAYNANSQEIVYFGSKQNFHPYRKLDSF